MSDNMRILLQSFGYDTHTAALITAQAVEHKLTLTDVAGWIREATHSHTIRNPRAFVRAVISRGDKPPAPEASRSRHLSASNYLSSHFCPDCQARPCVCNWDPSVETLSEHFNRTAPDTGGVP